MIDYFEGIEFSDDEEFIEVEEEYMIERPRMGLLEDVAAYDRDYINRILNGTISDVEKKMIAAVVYNWQYDALESNFTSRSFEAFLVSVNGKEWYDKMMSGWIRRKGAVFAKQVDCPEMMPPGVFFLNSDDLDVDDE